MTPDQIEYELPYARALQLLAVHQYRQGVQFGRELALEETFDYIAGLC